ncbi:MAG: hypothetical protein IJL69_06575, partial [Oscillospiraceae bacterium]|nr:hypothetical protein [Oscillospiraceae bacterium]
MFDKIAVIPNTTKDLSGEAARSLFSRLRAGCGAVALPAGARPFLPYLSEADVLFAPDDAALFDGAGLIVVLGGDGSVIDAARRAARFGIPM